MHKTKTYTASKSTQVIQFAINYYYTVMQNQIKSNENEI